MKNKKTFPGSNDNSIQKKLKYSNNNEFESSTSLLQIKNGTNFISNNSLLPHLQISNGEEDNIEDNNSLRPHLRISNGGEDNIDEETRNIEIDEDRLLIPSCDIPSQWDPNYDESIYLPNKWFKFDNWKNYYGFEFNTMNSILLQKNVLISPIYEFLHNKIVELIPFGIHNIWFYALSDTDHESISKGYGYFKEAENKKWRYKNFGDGIHLNHHYESKDEIDFDFFELDIDDLMKYVEDWAYLSFDVIIMNDIWSAEHECYCKCFQFRGYTSREFDYSPSSKYRASEADIKSVFPNYYNREFIHTNPFSEEQIVLRQQFDERVNEYYLNKKFVANYFNRAQEKPILRYIIDYVKYESVRYSYQKVKEYNNNFTVYHRTYGLSFTMLPYLWSKLVENKRYRHLTAREKGRIWTPSENINSIVLRNVTDSVMAGVLMIGMGHVNQPYGSYKWSLDNRNFYSYHEEEDIVCSKPINPWYNIFDDKFGGFPPFCDRKTRLQLNQIRTKSNNAREEYLMNRNGAIPRITYINNDNDTIKRISNSDDGNNNNAVLRITNNFDNNNNDNNNNTVLRTSNNYDYNNTTESNYDID